MATTMQTPAGTAQEMIAKKRVFNLDSFTKETKEVKYTPRQLNDVGELSSVDTATLLKAVNLYLQRSAMLEAKQSIAGASPKVINTFVNGFRMIPPYSKMERPDQTKAIFEFIKSQPALLNALKEAAVEASADNGEDEDDED